MPKYELNKDNYRHGKVGGGLTKLQPFTENCRQKKNVESGRNSLVLPREEHEMFIYNK